MSEYDVEYIHIKGEDNVLADGMSRMPVSAMGDSNPTGDWEDVAMAESGGVQREKMAGRQVLDSRRSSSGSGEMVLENRESGGDQREGKLSKEPGSDHNPQTLGELHLKNQEVPTSNKEKEEKNNQTEGIPERGGNRGREGHQVETGVE